MKLAIVKAVVMVVNYSNCQYDYLIPQYWGSKGLGSNLGIQTIFCRFLSVQESIKKGAKYFYVLRKTFVFICEPLSYI